MSKQLCLPRRKSLGDLSSTDLKLDLESDSGVSVNEQKAIESIHGEFDSKITSKDKQIEELQKEILSLKEFSENQELIRQQEQATIMAENFQLKQLIRKQKTTIIKGAKCIEFLKREIEKTKNHEKEYQRKVEEMENEVEKSKELIENMTEQSAEFVEENKHVILDKMVCESLGRGFVNCQKQNTRLENLSAMKAIIPRLFKIFNIYFLKLKVTKLAE